MTYSARELESVLSMFFHIGEIYLLSSKETSSRMPLRITTAERVKPAQPRLLHGIRRNVCVSVQYQEYSRGPSPIFEKVGERSYVPDMERKREPGSICLH